VPNYNFQNLKLFSHLNFGNWDLFGIWHLVIGASDAERRLQLKIPSDCLSKTQLSANPQGEV